MNEYQTYIDAGYKPKRMISDCHFTWSCLHKISSDPIQWFNSIETFSRGGECNSLLKGEVFIQLGYKPLYKHTTGWNTSSNLLLILNGKRKNTILAYESGFGGSIENAFDVDEEISYNYLKDFSVEEKSLILTKIEKGLEYFNSEPVLNIKNQQA